MTDYGPSLKAARLYEKTSAEGNMSLAGRWGGLKVATVKSREPKVSVEEDWKATVFRH